MYIFTFLLSNIAILNTIVFSKFQVVKPGFIWFAKELVYVRENDARFGIGVKEKE